VPSSRSRPLPSFEEIRARVGGRVGLYALDTGTGKSLGMDEDSRYAMASTFKSMLAALVLQQVDAQRLSLQQSIRFEPSEVVTYSPVVSLHTERQQISIETLCRAVVEVSDNTAANILLRLTGGPAGFTQFMRSIGDRETRLDRLELELNSNLPGDVRDTTTPRAMVMSLQRVLTRNVLRQDSRALLIDWLVSAATGLRRIRAGLPAHWRAGDKTGTGSNGAVNDIAILWPPSRKPILAAVYMSESTAGTEALSAAHAQIGRLIAENLA
jgi:beta-lactamase class A